MIEAMEKWSSTFRNKYTEVAMRDTISKGEHLNFRSSQYLQWNGSIQLKQPMIYEKSPCVRGNMSRRQINSLCLVVPDELYYRMLWIIILGLTVKYIDDFLPILISATSLINLTLSQIVNCSC
jgi:hypothetical protein